MTCIKTFTKHLTQVLLLVITTAVISSCGSSSSAPVNLWSWVSGSDVVGQSGTYGTQGSPDSANVPGARRLSISWTDASNNFWLFGGSGRDKDGTPGRLNDLWRWDGSDWTWISGSNVVNQAGNYGTQGVTSGTNMPGARTNSISWTDANGRLWLFGGLGLDSTGGVGRLSDLWSFTGVNWTWVSGSKFADQFGSYGTQGVAANTNVPGARNSSVSWTDSSGDLWLFGGFGYDSDGSENYLNDLWRWDGSDWTWISGSKFIDQFGSYGTQGTAASGNVPGARDSSVSWTDSSGDLWLFGGLGYDKDGTFGLLNDLWRWDGANWAWISGSDVVNQFGSYGTQGTAANGNVPGARYLSISWTDTSGNLWLLGGNGNGSAGVTGRLNDLWRFDGSNWTWISGSDVIAQSGGYGTQGVADAANMPGARESSISWTDTSGNLWLFGGNGYDSAGTPGNLNDLWRYQP